MHESIFLRLLGSGVEITQLGTSHDCHLYRISGRCGREFFVKASERPHLRLFEAEAKGLQWLRETQAVAIPNVIEHGPQFIALDWIATTTPSTHAAESFGRQLALMHRYDAPAFGAPWQGFLADLELDNKMTDVAWSHWFPEFRLLPYARIAFDRGDLSRTDMAKLEYLIRKLPEFGGSDEPPSRIHGDCWYGNLLWTDHGVYLIDPAAHGGHRETDIAMLRLFNAPHLDIIVGAYNGSFPFAEGWRERQSIHQLYALLFHTALFGARYRARTMSAIEEAIGSR